MGWEVVSSLFNKVEVTQHYVWIGVLRCIVPVQQVEPEFTVFNWFVWGIDHQYSGLSSRGAGQCELDHMTRYDLVYVHGGTFCEVGVGDNCDSFSSWFGQVVGVDKGVFWVVGSV